MTYLSVTAYYFVKKSLLISFIHDLGTLHTDLSGSRIMTDLIHDFSAIYSVFKRLYLFILMVLARILMVFVAPPTLAEHRSFSYFVLHVAGPIPLRNLKTADDELKGANLSGASPNCNPGRRRAMTLFGDQIE